MTERPVTILLVEDNPDDVELTLHAMERHKLANKIHVVRDGEEALIYLFGDENTETPSPGKHPRLILLDLKLPKVDGLEVLKTIKKRKSTKKIPVVILTSSAEEQDVIDSYELGVNSYITKPVDFKQFTDAIDQIGYYWLLLNKSPD